MKRFPNLARVRGHTIWLTGLGSQSIVVDAGAHKGEFSRTLTDRFGCQCHLIEANPDLAALLVQQGFHHVLPAALSGNDGHARFVHRANKESGGIFTRPAEADGNTVEIETLNLPTLLRRIGIERIALLKLDIEGAEFDLIAKTPDEVLQQIEQITVECHDFLPEFQGRGLYEALKNRLESLGFVTCCMAFRTHGDVLFLNRVLCRPGPVAKFYLRHIARWIGKLTGN